MTKKERDALRAQFERHWPQCDDGDSCGLRSESRTALGLLDAIGLLEAEAALLDRWVRDSSESGWSTQQNRKARRRAAELRARAFGLELALPEWARSA